MVCKRIIIGLTVFTLVSVIAAALMRPSVFESSIRLSFSQLPRDAQLFIKTHFSEYGLASITTVDRLLWQTYTVHLADGSRIEFDKDGLWTVIESDISNVPFSAIPTPITDYINDLSHTLGIRHIELGRMGYYYVGLSNGTKLTFDSALAFVGYD